jgi:hypothetical protein
VWGVEPSVVVEAAGLAFVGAARECPEAVNAAPAGVERRS